MMQRNHNRNLTPLQFEEIRCDVKPGKWAVVELLDGHARVIGKGETEEYARSFASAGKNWMVVHVPELNGHHQSGRCAEVVEQ